MILARIFYASLALNALVFLVAPSLTLSEERFDLARAQVQRREGKGAAYAELSRFTPLQISDDVRLLEDGAPLPFPFAAPADVASLGSGRYCVFAKRTVYWSSRDGSDPLQNGRRYELACRPNGAFTLSALALSCASLLLGVLAWRTGAVSFQGVSSLRVRALVSLVVLASLGAGLSRGWDRVFIGADSGGYVTHSATRPALYPAFVDVFDRAKEEPRTALTSDEGLVPLVRPESRFLFVVRAQKVLTVLALATLVFVLSSGINAWLVAALAYVGILLDLAHGGPASAHFNVSSVMSEGVNHALVFFYLAAIFAYLGKPALWRGVGLALLVALLVLARPADTALAVGLGLVFLVDLGREGWKKALARSLVFGLALLAPLLLACGLNAEKTGHFKLHAFTSWPLICVAFEVAEPEDVEAFPEPDLHAYMQICLVENRALLRPELDVETLNDAENVNLWKNALPSFGRVFTTPPGESPDYYKDEVFGKIAKRLLARHRGAYARLVIFHVAQLLGPLTPVLVATVAAALFFYRRSRAYQLLYVAFFATIPFAFMTVTCFLQFPIDRYRSQLGFAESLAPLLLVAVLVTLGREERKPS